MKARFKVLLIDECLTSQICPNCSERLMVKFKRVPNQSKCGKKQRSDEQSGKKRRGTVLCHSILRCTSGKCTSDGKYRTMQKDTMAGLDYQVVYKHHWKD